MDIVTTLSSCQVDHVTSIMDSPRWLRRAPMLGCAVVRSTKPLNVLTQEFTWAELARDNKTLRDTKPRGLDKILNY